MEPDTILTERQQQLFEWLRAQITISLSEIQERFKISAPTAYRDMRALIEAGQAIKINQGIKLVPAAVPRQPEGKCTFCGGDVNPRVAFVLLTQDGQRQTACCPHCGLMVLDQPGIQSALSCDFLHGRMVNARQAAFLVNSQVFVCCDPSVLCFADMEEARRFQLGFGGEICSLEQARNRVLQIMSFKADGSMGESQGGH
jgi:hypothetical protein